MKSKKQQGFTLIELLVVTAIISLLSSTVLVSLKVARAKGRDIVRIENLKEVQKALELYYADFGAYPISGHPGDYFTKTTNIKIVDIKMNTECEAGVMIPALVPAYIRKLPRDPSLTCGGFTHGMSYASNGKDFKLITHPEGGNAADTLFLDPSQDGGAGGTGGFPNGGYCIFDPSEGVATEHWGVWTIGALCWPI